MRYGQHPYYETPRQQQWREYREQINGKDEGSAPASRVDCQVNGTVQGKRY